MGRFLRTYRELFLAAALLLLPLIVYAAQVGHPLMPGVARSAVVFVTSPIQRGLAWTAATGQDLWYGYLDLRRVRNETLALRAENHALRALETRLAETQAENQRLRRLAHYVEAEPDLTLLAAPVLAYGPDPKFKGLRIGRGSNEGLRVGLPVITPDGVVGRLQAVYANASDVQLITDPQSTIAAQSQRSRARASARGLGSQERLRLDYVVRSDDLEDGDILVTAPSGGLFPKGLKIGRATGVSRTEGGLFKRAELVPAVDFDRLEEVLVVLDTPASASLGRPLAGLPH